MAFYVAHPPTTVLSASVVVHITVNKHIITAWKEAVIKFTFPLRMFRCMLIIIEKTLPSFMKAFNDLEPLKIVYLNHVHFLDRKPHIFTVGEIIAIIPSKIKLTWVSFFHFILFFLTFPWFFLLFFFFLSFYAKLLSFNRLQIIFSFPNFSLIFLLLFFHFLFSFPKWKF